MLNENKICFIICTNSELYIEECLWYISHLHVPIGYKVDTITIQEAASMTEGYHAAMLLTDAKYKIYLHQDVFIVNHFFLDEIINIFQQNKKIGMLGMVGAELLPESGVMWETRRCGKVYTSNSIISKLCEYANVNGSYQEVEAVDGLLLATQYDITWRFDLFCGWDFYDISQCMEFKRSGLLVVVPRQEKPWCFHDSSVVNSDNYDKWRIVFLDEYRDEMSCYTIEHAYEK